MAIRANREQVLAFRLASQNLVRRLPRGALLESAGACGVEDYPPGSAALALNARVLDLTEAEIERALIIDKTLLRARSMRTAPYVFPACDIHVFTTGLLADDEESLRFFILGAGPALDKVGLSATEVVRRTAAELLDVLDGRILTFRRLSAELTGRVSRHLSPQQLEAWNSPSWYGPNQSLGEAIIHFALYAISLRGLFCFAPRQGNEASFVRTDQWLGKSPRGYEPDAARAELVRRYLHCYGPTTVEHFGQWAGIAPAAANRIWRLIEPGLVTVDFEGRTTWLYERDLPVLNSPPAPEGVRLLPPHDPYMAQRDRETLLPDKALHRHIWRGIGNPGVVLADGRIVAVWRHRRKGKRLVVTVESFAALSGRIRSRIEDEVDLMARFRGCTAADTIYVD